MLSTVKEDIEKLIQKQKNEVMDKNKKIRDEQIKLDFISKPKQGTPIVNVNINMGNNDKNSDKILQPAAPLLLETKGGSKNVTRRKY